MLREKLTSTLQKHYPDLLDNTSSAWDFCACSSDVVSRGNPWWRRHVSAVFSGWGNVKMVNLKPWHEKRKVPINTDTKRLTKIGFVQSILNILWSQFWPANL